MAGLNKLLLMVLISQLILFNKVSGIIWRKDEGTPECFRALGCEGFCKPGKLVDGGSEDKCYEVNRNPASLCVQEGTKGCEEDDHCITVFVDGRFQNHTCVKPFHSVRVEARDARDNEECKGCIEEGRDCRRLSYELFHWLKYDTFDCTDKPEVKKPESESQDDAEGMTVVDDVFAEQPIEENGGSTHDDAKHKDDSHTPLKKRKSYPLFLTLVVLTIFFFVILLFLALLRYGT